MTTAQIERLISRGAEVRAKGEGKDKKLVGYAAMFNSPSHDMGGFVEVIRPGAFARALREGQDVVCLFNHDMNQVLGRTSARTLTLKEDAKGLYFECALPDTGAARDVLVSVEREDIQGCSFRFMVNRSGPTPGAKWMFTDGATPDVRELLDVDLIDVGPCTDPAYPATEVNARNYQAAREEYRRGTGAANRIAGLRLAEAEL